MLPCYVMLCECVKVIAFDEIFFQVRENVWEGMRKGESLNLCSYERLPKQIL